MILVLLSVQCRADEWDVNKWAWEGALKVVSKGEDCIIKLEDKSTGKSLNFKFGDICGQTVFFTVNQDSGLGMRSVILFTFVQHFHISVELAQVNSMHGHFCEKASRILWNL